ncbi:hypothetical protein ACJJTC_006554 [Scirpophaga incertulas]
MPALRLLGRKWLFASDDLVFPCILEIPYRLLWMGLMCYALMDRQIVKCDFISLAKLELAVLVGVQVVMVILLAVTAQQSARGSITDVEQRKYVGPLLLCRLFVLFVEVAANIIGVYWIFLSVSNCTLRPYTKVIMQSTLIITWIPLLLTFLAIYMAYDPLGNVEYEDLRTQEEREYYHKKSTQIWVSRVQWTFWYFKDKKMKDAVDEIAALFSTLFRSTDIVLYDIIAGSILLRIRQKKDTRDRRMADSMDSAEEMYTTDLRKIYREAPSWMNLEEAYHYMKLSMSAYGWLFVLYQYCCAGICFLMPYLRCCFNRPQNVVGDNCCMCNYAGLRQLSDVPEKDFIHISFKNHIFEVPFYVIAEHDRKRIVVTIRGSHSIEDMFTDLTSPAVKFEADGLPENSFAHKGMVLSTEKTIEQLMPILDRTFAEYPDYDLIITGHSLGAAVSILLGIKLRPKFPNLRVFAFAAPSGLLTREAARYTESFVMTVGIGDDLIMRISLKSAQSFRDRLNETIHMTRLPKYRILWRGLWYMMFKIPDSDLDSTWRAPDDMEAQLVGPPRIARSISYELERLYIGGRVLHIIRHKPIGSERNHSKQEHKYKMRWATAEDFTELVVMPRMLLDHLPDKVLEPIKKILDECSNDSVCN